jgi:hypothetical protein
MLQNKHNCILIADFHENVNKISPFVAYVKFEMLGLEPNQP